MTALTLAIDNAATPRRLTGTPIFGNGVTDGSTLQHDRAVRQAGDDDFVLATLSRVQILIERIANRRRAMKLARNRVETLRQLAKLPARVRNDLLQAEQKVIRSPDTSCYVQQ
ncbi:hypothetical protein [Sinorhizobium americanum]|uniref:Uncharacterized protein n=1 Tax=Sinorhizobium americanum TaxID=194963 RepID=A0A1L3LNA2_9HYPH|nr:hypothetical protein [Sinorhizobium americanum]APG84873.1 hypothetical protein SAMCCGM7_Ch2128 [Sinorhizobium americanum CCGM7]APG91516.1 hypothetical protein SAMCFNEI73_Ch2233 [Sinorhizobium americanum]OAP37436.1 hypothetical protein ATC00_10155 [Sinorhizobium americanum]TCN29081.1 hypothetical protein EV184_111183 [Sinorhizobium americanum]